MSLVHFYYLLRRLRLDPLESYFWARQVVEAKSNPDSVLRRRPLRRQSKYGHGESHTCAATILFAFACGLAREDNRVVARPGTLPSWRPERCTHLGPGGSGSSELQKAGRLAPRCFPDTRWPVSPAKDDEACRTTTDAEIYTDTHPVSAICRDGDRVLLYLLSEFLLSSVSTV